MPETQAAELKPEVEASCVVCGGAARELICSAAEVRAQRDYLRRFHRRRLRPARGRRDAHALADRAEFTQDYVTEIVSCRDCGLLLREPRPPASAVLAAYREDEYGAQRLAALFEAQRETFRGKARQLQRHLTSPRPFVVEIGSFVGGFLAAAQELGWQAIGLDPGAEVDEFCRAKGLTVHRTVAERAPIEPGSVDCVAIWNTFDQLPDPRPTLAAVRRWLRRDGVLVLRVPNGAAFRAAMRLHRALVIDAPLLPALAWNNLLGFPYLYGYAAAPLDRLLADFRFTRRAFQPDTLVRLADEETTAWGVWEERLLKALWRVAASFDAGIAPWFDAYYSRRRDDDGS
jgi:SAM-dependent methyltransferase